MTKELGFISCPNCHEKVNPEMPACPHCSSRLLVEHPAAMPRDATAVETPAFRADKNE